MATSNGPVGIEKLAQALSEEDIAFKRKSIEPQHPEAPYCNGQTRLVITNPIAEKVKGQKAYLELWCRGDDGYHATINTFECSQDPRGVLVEAIANTRSLLGSIFGIGDFKSSRTLQYHTAPIRFSESPGSAAMALRPIS